MWGQLVKNPWEVLGIEPCPDRRRVRKAYVLRLKETHPEDDPEGFQELRQAYEMVLAFLDVAIKVPPEGETPAPSHTQAPEPADSTVVPASPEPKRPSTLEKRVVRFPPPAPSHAEAVAILMERARGLCDAGLSSSTGVASGWRSLLDDDALWNLETRSRFEKELFDHLARSKRELEPKVWLLLEEAFHWREQSLALYRTGLPRDSVDHVLGRIHLALTRSRLAPAHVRETRKRVPHAFRWMESLGESETEERPWLDGLLRRLLASIEHAPFILLALFFLNLAVERQMDRWRSSQSASPRASSKMAELERTAELGSPTAAMELAEHLAYGDELPRDRARAVALYQQAARFGYPRAMRRLGDAYREGWVETDFEESARWYRLAAEQGDPWAEWHLAVLSRDGQGVPQDHEAAFTWMLSAAKHGLTGPQAWVGYLYEHGEGVERDEAEALIWYRRAAAQSHRWSQLQLGRLYLTGKVVERDEDEAAFWLTLASRDPGQRKRALELSAPLTSPFDGERRRALEARVAAWEAQHR